MTTLLLTVMIYLHSDTKAAMKEIKADMNERMDRIEDELKEIKTLIQNK